MSSSTGGLFKPSRPKTRVAEEAGLSIFAGPGYVFDSTLRLTFEKKKKDKGVLNEENDLVFAFNEFCKVKMGCNVSFFGFFLFFVVCHGFFVFSFFLEFADFLQNSKKKKFFAEFEKIKFFAEFEKIKFFAKIEKFFCFCYFLGSC